MREHVAGRPVEVVYAGTGPFAALALPLAALLVAGEVRFTLLDVHERSVASVGRLVERLGLETSVRRLLVADGTRFGPSGDAPVDVVLVEAMQRGLGVEPQVALTRHLARFLQPAGVVVPARVRVDLALSDPRLETADTLGPFERAASRVPLGPVFELTKESAETVPDSEGRFPPVSVRLPVATSAERQPMLFTTVGVHGPHVLGEGDSGITAPEVLWQVPALPAGSHLELRYQLGPLPGLRCAWGAAGGPGHGDR